MKDDQLKQLLLELSFYDDARELNLDMKVGERGSRLSGGQAQKIELARVSHIDIPVIILDETTSALDVKSEQHAIDLLRRTRQGKSTLVLISHRLYAAENADMVVFMDGGRIVATGSHKSLLSTNKAYDRFWTRRQINEHESQRIPA